MPESVPFSDTLMAKLRAVVDAHNSRHGTDLTVKQWILQTLKEVAVQDELAASFTAFQQQNEEEHEAAKRVALEAFVAAERERLLAGLG